MIDRETLLRIELLTILQSRSRSGNDEGEDSFQRGRGGEKKYFIMRIKTHARTKTGKKKPLSF